MAPLNFGVAGDPGKDDLRAERYAGEILYAVKGCPLVRPSLLAAVGLRESWLGWAPGYHPRGTHLGFGDSGNAFGLWQADFRAAELMIRNLVPGPDFMSPRGQAQFAAEHLESSYRILRAAFPHLTQDQLDAAACAAYNARLGAVAMQIHVGRSVDEVTTGRDYSKDVLAREAALRRANPGLWH